MFFVRKLTVALAAIVSVVAFMAGTAVSEAKPSKTTVIAVQKKLGVSAAPKAKEADDSSAAASSGDAAATLQRIAQCESGGNPSAVSADGTYRGKYQFDRETWRRMGGSGDPADAPEAEQDRIAAALLAQRGTAPWPVCG